MRALILAITVVPLLVGAEPAPEGATVIGISGRWAIDDNRAAQKNREVHFGQKIAKRTHLRGEKGAHIVFQCGGPGFDNQGCPAGACAVRVCEKDSGTAGTERFAWLASTLNLISRDPDRFITAVTRGLGPEAWEAVVNIRANALDLAPILRALPAGVYRLKLSNLPDRPAFLSEHPVTWATGGTAAFPAPGIRPGVYSVVVVDGPGDIQGSEVWVLAAPPDAAPGLLRSWKQVEAAIRPWRDDVEAVYLHAFLRATLVSLLPSAPLPVAGR